MHPESICYLLRKLYEHGQHLRVIEDNDKQRTKNKEGRKKGEATEQNFRINIQRQGRTGWAELRCGYQNPGAPNLKDQLGGSKGVSTSG